MVRTGAPAGPGTVVGGRTVWDTRAVLLEAAAGSFGMDVTGAGIARLPIPVPPPGEEEPLPAEPETPESESPP